MNESYPNGLLPCEVFCSSSWNFEPNNNSTIYVSKPIQINGIVLQHRNKNKNALSTAFHSHKFLTYIPRKYVTFLNQNLN